MLTLKIILGLLALILGGLNHVQTLQNEQEIEQAPFLENGVEDPCSQPDEPDAGRHTPVRPCPVTPRSRDSALPS